MDQIGPWSPEEDEMLLNLIKKHGRNWSLISKSIPGRSDQSCWSRFVSLANTFTPVEDEMLLNLIEKHGRNWSLISKSIPGQSDMSCALRWDTVWKPLWNSTLKRKSSSMTNEDITIEGQGNLSHEVGGVSGQAPSIGDMVRDNVSQPSGGMHPYSGEQSAPSRDAFNKRDSSSMMIDSDSVQQFVGSEFGQNDFTEISSKA